MNKLYLLLFVVFSLAACKTTQEITGTQVNEKALKHEPFNKVCVLALAKQQDLKDRIESKMVKAMERYDINAVASNDIMENQLTSLDKMDAQFVDSILTASGCDALFAMSLVDAKREAKYVRDTDQAKVPEFSYKYYDNYQSYFSYRNSEMMEQGNVFEETTYIVESIMYNVKTKERVWSIRSEALQPSSIKSWIRGYSKLIAAELDEKVGFKQ